MRNADPVSGVPDSDRYRGNGAPDNIADPDRYGPLRGRGPAGQYEHRATTLEEEAKLGGWIPAAHPTTAGPEPIRLFTIGMRGEPGFDDDNDPAYPGYRDGGPGADISSSD